MPSSHPLIDIVWLCWSMWTELPRLHWLLCLTSLVPKSLTTSTFSSLHQNLLETERDNFSSSEKIFSASSLLRVSPSYLRNVLAWGNKRVLCCPWKHLSSSSWSFHAFLGRLFWSRKKNLALWESGTCGNVHITMSSSQEGKGHSYDHDSYEECYSCEPNREIIHVSEKTLDCLTYLLVFNQYICCVAEAC